MNKKSIKEGLIVAGKIILVSLINSLNIISNRKTTFELDYVNQRKAVKSY